MAEAKKTGALTFDELLELWKSGTDEAYSSALLAAEDGAPLVGQLLAQMALVSRAIDETFQTLFITPHSGQTGEPASGPRRSTVMLTLSRASGLHVPLAFPPGGLRAEELFDDFGPEGPVPTRSGRSYALSILGGLLPGQTEIPLPFAAERAGRGHDMPRPGTVRAFVQPGAGLTNDGATATPAYPLHRLTTAARADAPVPENVGSYVLFEQGANQGRIARVAGYEPPAEDGSDGGTLLLAATGVFVLSLLSGTFEPGEPVEQQPSGAGGVFLMGDSTRLVLDRTSGAFELVQVVVGQRSGAQAVFSSFEQSPEIVAESGTATWRILSWGADLGLRIANALSPSGGRAGALDEIGLGERNLPREGDEPDEPYRERVSRVADTVSPNAIRRTVNRVLASSGRSGVVREVGRLDFQGLYFDAEGGPLGTFAYDMEPDERPGDVLKVQLDHAEFRAFFLVEILGSDEGEFGCAYDAGPSNAYDASPWLGFYDGFGIGSAIEARAVWRAVDKARACGVGFDLVRAFVPHPAPPPV